MASGGLLEPMQYAEDWHSSQPDGGDTADCVVYGLNMCPGDFGGQRNDVVLPFRDTDYENHMRMHAIHVQRNVRNGYNQNLHRTALFSK